MKKILLFLSLILAIGCQEHKEDLDTSDDEISVEFACSADETLDASRTLSGSSDVPINDLNIYMISAKGEVYRRYATNNNFLLKLKPDNYTIFAVANIGRDLGVQTAESLRTLKLSLPQLKSTLSYSKQLSITTPQRLQVKLKRNYATVKIKVLSPSPSYILKSIQIKNIPIDGKLFEDEKVTSTSASDFKDLDEVKFDTWITSYDLEFEMPENRQGDNLSITDQKNKGEVNAPKLATYAYILVEYGTNVFVTYKIYLGENNTSNFDVKRNQKHDYVINIKGKNIVDTRVNTYDLTMYLSYNAAEKYGYIEKFIPFKLTARAGGNEKSNISFQLPSDFYGRVKWNNQPVSAATRSSFSAESGVENVLEIMSFTKGSFAVVTTATNRWNVSSKVTSTIHASEAPKFSLSTSVVGLGSVAVFLDGKITLLNEFEKGTKLKLVATAQDGYTFTGWKGLTQSTSTIELTIEKDVTVTAIFEQLITLNVTTIGEGRFDVYKLNEASGVYELTTKRSFLEGTQVKVISIPIYGWSFGNWSAQEGSKVSLEDYIPIKYIGIYKDLKNPTKTRPYTAELRNFGVARLPIIFGIYQSTNTTNNTYVRAKVKVKLDGVTTNEEDSYWHPPMQISPQNPWQKSKLIDHGTLVEIDIELTFSTNGSGITDKLTHLYLSPNEWNDGSTIPVHNGKFIKQVKFYANAIDIEEVKIIFEVLGRTVIMK